MGPIERNIAVQSMRAGQGLPERIENAPELTLGLDIYLQAYIDLDTERPAKDMAIPWSKVIKYAEVNQFSAEQRELALYHVRMLDAGQLAKQAEKLKPKGVKNGKNAARPR